MLAPCPFLGFLQILQVVLEWLSPWARKLVSLTEADEEEAIHLASASTAQIGPLCLQHFLLVPSIDITLPSIPFRMRGIYINNK